MIQNAGQQLIPFRFGSRKRVQRVGSIPFSDNAQAAPLELPKVGYLAAVILQFTGTLSGTGVGVTTDGAHALVRRLVLKLNLGTVPIYSTSGFGNALLQRVNGHHFDRDSRFHAVAAGAVTWRYYIPVSANLGENFGIGLINLQAPEIRATIEVTWGTLTDAFTGTGLSMANGALNVYYVYWEVPDPSRVRLPQLVLHRIEEDRQPISQTGDNIYTLPRQGVLLQLIHALRLNGARSDSWDTYRLRLNRVDTLIEANPATLFALEYRNTAGSTNALTTGVIPINFFGADERPESGDNRDALDTEAVTTTESIVTVSSGATLGSNNNFLDSIRRIVQVIQP